ncbi:hypothetical protein [Natronolimnobius baerhuensis]|uniref:Uncharacterized protein n=1 Tax=Natronolimnobius baerhuensis TaxID=253108 RepID=A0A202EDD1_9EURY|nr:hypothetical protein [Natronolimnobius baerhuensis]OVE86000.1 hypothetical protein B2G88_04160 [Natronolimnobius baerhuensis]
MIPKTLTRHNGLLALAASSGRCTRYGLGTWLEAIGRGRDLGHALHSSSIGVAIASVRAV